MVRSISEYLYILIHYYKIADFGMFGIEFIFSSHIYYSHLFLEHHSDIKFILFIHYSYIFY